jgi:RNA polymerase sigma factor (sigma-70 family)
MVADPETRWSLIQAASDGDPEARAMFARLYLPIVRSYLSARWAGRPLAAEVDDATQEVFLDCFRKRGALARLAPGRSGGGFRAYLFGVVRYVALRLETRRAREFERRQDGCFSPEQMAANEASLSRIFDREWARSVMREAADLLALKARLRGLEAVRRVEILRLRFQEDLPIREIARRWDVEAARVHREYSKARKEFLEVLGAVVKNRDGCPAERVEEECRCLLVDLQG